jgi:hypothetical protein
MPIARRATGSLIRRLTTSAALALFAKRALDPHQEQFAVAGRSERAANALEQGHVHPGLQSCQRSAHGRLAGSELFGGARDVLEPPGDAEEFEQAPIDFGYLGSRVTPPWGLSNSYDFDINPTKIGIGQHDFSGLSVGSSQGVGGGFATIGISDSRPYKRDHPVGFDALAARKTPPCMK